MDLKIKERRVRAGYTRRIVSDAVGISEVSLFNYENGITTPNLATTKKIAQFLDCSVDELLGRDMPEND